MTLMANHHSEMNTLPPMEFSYTSCTDLYSTMAEPPYVSHRPSTQSGKSRSALYTRCTTTNDPHTNSPLRNDHTAANGVFIHPPYIVVLNPIGGCRTVPKIFVQ